MAKFTCPYCYGQHEKNSYGMNSEYRCDKTGKNIPLSCVVDSAGLTVALFGGVGCGKSTYLYCSAHQ